MLLCATTGLWLALVAPQERRRLSALCGEAAAVLMLSGLALWWPLRRDGALRVRLRAGSRAALPTSHRSAGVLLGLVVPATAASGVYVAWRPIATWGNALAGTSRPPPPALPLTPDRAMAGPVPSAGGTGAADRVTEPPPARDALAARMQGWLYTCHAGKLWRLPHTALLVLAGVALMWLALSGPLAWGLRRRTRSRGTIAIANTPHPS